MTLTIDDSDNFSLNFLKKFKQEWSYTLCQITTIIEKDRRITFKTKNIRLKKSECICAAVEFESVIKYKKWVGECFS